MFSAASVLFVCLFARILLQGARAGGTRVPKFVVTKSSRSESHLALGLQNMRAFANSGGHVPGAPCLTTPLFVCLSTR